MSDQGPKRSPEDDRTTPSRPSLDRMAQMFEHASGFTPSEAPGVDLPPWIRDIHRRMTLKEKADQEIAARATREREDIKRSVEDVKLVVLPELERRLSAVELKRRLTPAIALTVALLAFSLATVALILMVVR